MKSAKVFYKIAYLIIVVLVAVFTVGSAFAWFFDRKDAEFSITGSSAGAYFESGNGSAEKPFIISNTTHMHNLAVLQNTGKLDTKYYYQIKKGVDIDMSGRYIPPIGNDAHPFIGDFNGNGQTLKNLQVTTNKTLLEDEYPLHATRGETGYKFSQAVGLFGMTGASSDIHNVILENPKVDVSATDTAYSSTARAYAGLAVGVVNGKASSIGVRAVNNGSALGVNVTGYSTFNSILGALGDGVTSSVTGGGHGNGGSGASFGSSFDVEGMYERLEKIDANKSSSTPSWRLPNLGSSSSDGITLGKLEKLPFTVTAESKYTGADDGEVVAANNIGYLLGNQNKVYKKNVTFGDKLIEQSDGKWTFPDGTNPSSGKIPRWIYRLSADNISSNTYDSNSGFSALSDAEYAALPQGIKDLIPAQNGQVSGFQSVRMSQTYQNVGGQIYAGSDSNGQWSPHGQISWNGKTYGKGFTKTDYKGNAVDEKGDKILLQNQYNPSLYEPIEFYRYTEGIALPNCGIWFKPIAAGKIEIVMYAEDAGDGFALIKGHRTKATKENPFYVDYSTNGAGLESKEIGKYNLPSRVLFYFEFEVTEEDIADGRYEYWLMQYGSGGAYFVYMDLGASAAADTSTIDREKAVSAVDFIYDGVEINQKEGTTDSKGQAISVGNFIVSASGSTTAELYEASKTSVYFENIIKVLNMVYLRLNGDTSGATGGHVAHNGKTICLIGSTEGADKTAISTNSEVKATFATYVCPTISGGSGSSSSSGGGTVTPTPDDVKVSLIAINGAPAEMAVGGTVTLEANVEPSDATNKTVTWSSSNENVATVDSSGVVTAKAAGMVTITAEANDGSGISATTATITVNAGTTETLTALDLSSKLADGNGAKLSISDSASNYNFIIESSGNYKGNTKHKIDGVANTPVLIGNSDSVMSFTVSANNIVKIVIKLAVSNKNSSTDIDATLTAGTQTLTFKADSTDDGSLTSQNLELTLEAGSSVEVTTSAGRINIIAISYAIL